MHCHLWSPIQSNQVPNTYFIEWAERNLAYATQGNQPNYFSCSCFRQTSISISKYKRHYLNWLKKKCKTWHIWSYTVLYFSNLFSSQNKLFLYKALYVDLMLNYLQFGTCSFCTTLILKIQSYKMKTLQIAIPDNPTNFIFPSWD